MAEFVSNCPRCGSEKITFDCLGSAWVGQQNGWKNYAEVFVLCRKCHKPSIQLVAQKEYDEGKARILGKINGLAESMGAINDIVEFVRFVTLRDNHNYEVPELLPEQISLVVEEANSCLAGQCFNAAGAMYRLALDLATKSLLPTEGDPNARTRRSLGLRVDWLFDNNLLPIDLKPLAECLREDGNDGAHDGTLGKEDAEDLQDFCFELLRRLYTEPERLALAQQRRAARRKPSEG